MLYWLQNTVFSLCWGNISFIQQHRGCSNSPMHLSVKERITYNPLQTLEKLESTWDTFLELLHYTSLQKVSLKRGETNLYPHSLLLSASPLPYYLCLPSLFFIYLSTCHFDKCHKNPCAGNLAFNMWEPEHCETILVFSRFVCTIIVHVIPLLAPGIYLDS